MEGVQSVEKIRILRDMYIQNNEIDKLDDLDNCVKSFALKITPQERTRINADIDLLNLLLNND